MPWDAFYDGPAHGTDAGRAIALSPDGNTVFVTGGSTGVGSGLDYATIAYNAATGARVWLRRYSGPGDGNDQAVAIALSPDGSKVFVTGTSLGAGSGNDYATVAYNASSGAFLWIRRYNGPGNGDDEATGLAVSPDGTRVYVTGQSYGGASAGTDYATIAYNAATGARDWAHRYSGPGADIDTASGLTPTPDGKELVVTGTSRASSTQAAFVTVAYAPATGKQLWAERFNGPSSGNDIAVATVASPDSSKVFVTGTALSDGMSETLAYNASTGSRVWLRAIHDTTPPPIAVSPNGASVFISGDGCKTVSLSASTGARLWGNGGTGFDWGCDAIVVSPNGQAVWAVGDISDGHFVYEITELGATDGEGLGFGQFAPYSAAGDSNAFGVAVSPDSSTAYITGQSPGFNGDEDYLTLTCSATDVC